MMTNTLNLASQQICYQLSYCRYSIAANTKQISDNMSPIKTFWNNNVLLNSIWQEIVIIVNKPTTAKFYRKHYYLFHLKEAKFFFFDSVSSSSNILRIRYIACESHMLFRIWVQFFFIFTLLIVCSWKLFASPCIHMIHKLE